jgi:hypothetical protein
MPNVTDVIRDMLDKEAEYRLLSAITHGHHWALQQLSFQLADDAKVGATASAVVNNSTHLLEKHLAPNSVAYLCLEAVTAFTKSFWYMCQLFGWSIEDAKALLDRNYDRLQIRTELRFW